ncbi:serine hydrolase domain-containing protein [Gordonia paraffinivorans]|uniref:serine hydrolase domain-containing protein n=1 Tax=Gordonia paraffinivorans TaxID=175628 RepID=UPI001446F91E|nr:serine hydrolase domain-containing protein [Gordonia paraffinivorans]
MSGIQGICKEPFGELAEITSRWLSMEDGDVGSSVAVTIDGELVVDLWGGWMDAERTKPWQRDTLVNVFSTTKAMTSLAALVLVDRNELDLDAPVCHYWPEFAQNGKGSILVKHILSHTSGVSAWDPSVVLEDLYDWDKSTSLLSAQAPFWSPGQGSGYHNLNYGHLTGEVIRRITGKSLGTFFADEIAGPIGADFYIGLPPELDDRVATVLPPPPHPFNLDELDKDSVLYRTWTSPPCLDPVAFAQHANGQEWRRAEIGAANGHGNARSVACIQAAVANGGSFGDTTLLSQSTIDRIFETQANGTDLVLMTPLRWGIGYALPRPDTFAYLPQDAKVCFWGGWGGSMIIVDVDRRMTFAYMKNKLTPGIIGGPTATELITATYNCLNEGQASPTSSSGTAHV